MFPPSSTSDSNKFAVLSKRLLFFETKMKKNKAAADKASSDDQTNPLMVEFNQYYMSFSIVT